MNEEIQKTLDQCIEYASELLIETGEAYPFGAFVDTIGNVHPLEMEVDKKNIPTIGKVVEALTKYCEGEMAEGKMNAYAVTYEVALQLEENAEPQDCIAIDITHKEENTHMFYLPFQKDAAGKMQIGELFGVMRD